MTDTELLRLFTSEASNDAFTQLVTRHAGLVYAAALRQTRSTALASDITQAVFLDLARHARKLRADTHLPSWLITVTRRTSIDAIRRESRLRTREQTSAELAAVNASHTASSLASDLAPVLDEALDTLGDTDRRAVLLRFFENQSFHQIALHFGATEAAAKKRVTRALEKLRTQLARRGIATSATLLAAQLPLHAATPAPAALVAVISSQSFIAASITATASSSLLNMIFMTSTHKVTLVAALTFAAGGLFYQAHQISRLHRNSAAMQSDLARERQQLALFAEKQRSEQTASKARQPIFDASDPIAARLQVMLTRINKLKQRLASSPEESIPELALLDEDRWIQIANFSGEMNDEAGFRWPLADLRADAARVFSFRLQRALQAYLKKHANILPSQLTELLPFFEVTINPAILDRYELVATGNVKRSGDPIIIQQKFSTIVDEEYDSLVRMRLNNSQSVAVSELRRELAKATPEGKERDRLEHALDTAVQKYQDANPDKPEVPDMANITAYFENPTDAARAIEMIKARPIKARTVASP